MNFDNTITILALLAAIAGGVIIALRQRYISAGLFATSVGGTALLVRALFMPVSYAENSASGKPVDVIYLGYTDAGYIRDLAQLFDDPHRSVIVVAAEQSVGVVKANFANAIVEQPRYSGSTAEGVTLQVAFGDLEHRASELAQLEAQVHFFVPRTGNLARDLNMRDRIIRTHRSLASRLHWLIPGRGALASSTPLPTLSVDVPVEVDPLSLVDVNISGANKTGSQLRIGVNLLNQDPTGKYNESVVGLGVGNSLQVGSSAPIYLLEKPFSGKLQIRAPEQDKTMVLKAELRNTYGELAQSIDNFISTWQPRVTVLVRNNSDDARAESKLLSWLDVAKVPCTTVALKNVTPAQIANLGVLLVDIELSNADAGELLAVLQECSQSTGTVPQLVFFGTANYEAPPAGWHKFIGGVNVEPEVTRTWVVMRDSSGSMASVVTRLGNMSKVGISDNIAMGLKAGMEQRNINRMLVGVRPKNATDANPPVEVVSIDDYTKLGTNFHNWEGGPQLLALRKMVEDGAKVSDALLFWDNCDLSGLAGKGNDALVTTEQMEAANWLRERGVRLHIISIGGDLHPGNGWLCGCVKVKFDEIPSLDALSTAVKSQIYDVAFPRLEVRVEEAGLKFVSKASKQQMLRDSVGNVRLINLLGRFKATGTHEISQDSILLYAKHWQEETYSPLLVRGSYSLPNGNTHLVYWMCLDINAEFAHSPSNGTPAQRAIADLLMASINACTDHLERGPVVWLMDSDGRIVAMKRSRTPFNIEKDTMQAKTAAGVPGAYDLRRLTTPTFQFNNDSKQIDEASISFKDSDPTVDMVKVRLPVTPRLATPLNREVDLNFVGSGASTTGRSGAVAETPKVEPWRMPAFLMPWVIVAAWLGLALLVRHG